MTPQGIGSKLAAALPEPTSSALTTVSSNANSQQTTFETNTKVDDLNANLAWSLTGKAANDNLYRYWLNRRRS